MNSLGKIVFSMLITFMSLSILAQNPTSFELYELGTELKSRSISFENPTGEPGMGGQAASSLGVGRKGFPAKRIAPGETVVLCDINHSGTIRHIWMTGTFKKQDSPEREFNYLLRSTVIRAYWDGQEHPSIECPLGDFMGLAHGKVTSYESAVHSIGKNAAFNFWLPMPFASNAKITLTNESDMAFTLFYQIDYTFGDQHPEEFGRLHTFFRRENPTTIKQDFELMPKRTGKGRFIGAVMGVRTLHPGWWGEGEVKFYMDGDTEFPTICGTGSEDYIGLSYGIQQTSFKYLGANLVYKSDSAVTALNLKNNKMETMQRDYISMYRWHLPDPVYWEKECRVTIQQIGCCLYDRDDDWSTATFWYEPIPSTPLPTLPSKKERVADLSELFPIKERKKDPGEALQ
jgi:hypothetical protein